MLKKVRIRRTKVRNLLEQEQAKVKELQQKQALGSVPGEIVAFTWMVCNAANIRDAKKDC
jgi:hypothetical protein